MGLREWHLCARTSENGHKRSFQIIFQLPRILRVVVRTPGLENHAVSSRWDMIRAVRIMRMLVSV